MKVGKTVKNGNVELVIIPPEFPEGTIFDGSCFQIEISDMSSEKWCDLQVIYLGDYKHLVELAISKLTSAEKIAEQISNLHRDFMVEYQKFVEKHTENVEIADTKIVIQKLTDNNKLFYRNKSGQIKNIWIFNCRKEAKTYEQHGKNQAEGRELRVARHREAVQR